MMKLSQKALPPPKSIGGISKPQFSVLAILAVALSIIWTWYAGKDLNWDLLNYHYYAAYQWSENRLGKDFVGGSLQSYFNPTVYLPFYWMVQGGFHSFLIGAILASIHALNLLLIALIASVLLPSETRYRFLWVVLAILLAAINPVFITELGNTFADTTTSIFVLSGFLVYLAWIRGNQGSIGPARAGRSGDLKTWLIIGMCLGLACGLKLTNVMFALGFWPGVLAVRTHGQRYLERTLCYAVAGATGFALTGGYWAWRLFQEFGNPVFPLANNVFKSPDYPAVNLQDFRFIPDSFWEGVLLPIRALAAEQNVYTEWWSPDSRFLIFFVVLVAFCLWSCWRRVRPQQDTAAAAGNMLQVSAAFVWFTTYCIWLYISGNGRYFVGGLLLLGPIIVAFVYRLANGHRFAIYGLILLVAVQAGLMTGVQHRWAPAPWTASWFEVRAPESLREKPYLFLLPTAQSSSYLAPFLHPDSAFTNIAGQVAISENGPGGARVKSLIEKYEGNIRSLYRAGGLEKPGDEAYLKTITAFDGVYERFGLRTDTESCETIQVMDQINEEERTGLGNAWGFSHEPKGYVVGALSCRLIPYTGPRAVDTEMAKRVDHVFDRIESVCPRRFSPAGMVTMKYARGWARTYYNSVVTLIYFPERDQIEYLMLGGGTVRLGRLSDWETEAVPAHNCSIKKGSLLNQEALHGL